MKNVLCVSILSTVLLVNSAFAFGNDSSGGGDSVPMFKSSVSVLSLVLSNTELMKIMNEVFKRHPIKSIQINESIGDLPEVTFSTEACSAVVSFKREILPQGPGPLSVYQLNHNCSVQQ